MTPPLLIWSTNFTSPTGRQKANWAGLALSSKTSSTRSGTPDHLQIMWKLLKPSSTLGMKFQLKKSLEATSKIRSGISFSKCLLSLLTFCYDWYNKMLVRVAVAIRTKCRVTLSTAQNSYKNTF